MKNPLFWLLLPLSLVAILFLLAIFFTALAFMPAHISAVSLGILAVVVLWAFFGRRRSHNRPATEGALFGRQKSVEGML